MAPHKLSAAELSVEDFTFEGPLGSQGTTIEKIGTNHFKVVLGHAPEHPDWSNKLQFTIIQNAKGNDLQLDVFFYGGNAYIFNEYFSSWSYNQEDWHPLHWQKQSKNSADGDTLIFPTFTEDKVYVGHQVPMSYEKSLELIEEWKKDSYVSVHHLGDSIGKRPIYRITLTNPDSIYSIQKRWVHYFANQHPGEHNSQWRMVGMINWLLSPQGKMNLDRSICHFILMTSPDAPSHGWYRVNAQGVDMNRSYFVGGADSIAQAHEAYIVQKDLEGLMDAESPVTDLWSMHTWGGIVEPILIPGPEMGSMVEPWTELRDLIEKHDPQNLVEALKTQSGDGNKTYWTVGPHQQFGISAVLCEGAGAIYTKEENLQSGVSIIKGLMDYYSGVKP